MTLLIEICFNQTVVKEALITPVVKKPGLDVTDTSSYRPISNLSVLSKPLERLVVRQLMSYLTAADLLPRLQSGFRSGHSTETAVLRVLADILQAVDRGDSAALILLDLSAAFDTRPLHPSAAPADELRCQRHRSPLVPVVPG